MRNILTAVMGLAIVASAAQANTLKLWVNNQGPVTPGDPGVLDGVSAGDTLDMFVEVDGDWDAITNDVWRAISFDLLDTGLPMMINYTKTGRPPIPTWATDSDLGGGDGIVGLVSVSETIGLGSLEVGHINTNRPGNAVYHLGSVEALADIGLLRGEIGFARVGAEAGDDDVLIGNTLISNDDYPDDKNPSKPYSTVVLWTPEPASLVLIALAGLVIRRR